MFSCFVIYTAYSEWKERFGNSTCTLGPTLVIKQVPTSSLTMCKWKLIAMLVVIWLLTQRGMCSVACWIDFVVRSTRMYSHHLIVSSVFIDPRAEQITRWYSTVLGVPEKRLHFEINSDCRDEWRRESVIAVANQKRGLADPWVPHDQGLVHVVEVGIDSCVETLRVLQIAGHAFCRGRMEQSALSTGVSSMVVRCTEFTS